MNHCPPDFYAARTRIAFIWTSLLGMPFWAIYALLLFILYKDLHATPFQITVFITLRPLVSIFSIYWSSHVNKRRDRLRSNVIWAGILGHFPFLFLPWIDHPWFIILSSAFYMMLNRGVYPAWMEILKLNLPDGMRQRVVSYGSTFSFVGGGILSLLIGYLMDDHFEIWRWIFPLASLSSMLAACFQYRIPILINTPPSEPSPAHSISLISQVMQPWKDVWNLVRSRPDFSRFQLGYLLGGFGLVIVQPALPTFFIDTLDLSYTELTTAITLCKGVAFALTSSIWAEWLRKVNIYRFCSLVTILAGVFPFLLISAQWNLIWVFVAYLVYGVMQSGSDLSWHLSGPIFAKGEDSSLYSSVNLAVVGIRGCVAPLLGSLLVFWFSPTVVLAVGGAFSLLACWRMHLYHRTYHKDQESVKAV